MGPLIHRLEQYDDQIELVEVAAHGSTHTFELIQLIVEELRLAAPRLSASCDLLGRISSTVVTCMRLLDFAIHLHRIGEEGRTRSQRAVDITGIAYGSLLALGVAHWLASSPFESVGQWMRSCRRVAYVSHLVACAIESWNQIPEEGGDGRHQLIMVGALTDALSHAVEWWVLGHGVPALVLGLGGHVVMGYALVKD